MRKRIGLRLFSDLYAEKIAEHKLRTLFWECTLRCNLACRHCGSDCRVDPGVPDMPLADFLKVLDEEVTPHNRPEDVLLIFSGGEVLVRSDLEEAGREVTRRGYAWGMVTNGLALDADRLRSLMDAGLRSISISFDGFEDAHNYIRRNPRSFEKALDAIRLIVREPRLTYDVITCVTSPMVARLEEFKELLIAEGVKYWRIFSIFPVGRAKDDPTLAVTDAQFREVLGDTFNLYLTDGLWSLEADGTLHLTDAGGNRDYDMAGRFEEGFLRGEICRRTGGFMGAEGGRISLRKPQRLPLRRAEDSGRKGGAMGAAEAFCHPGSVAEVAADAIDHNMPLSAKTALLICMIKSKKFKQNVQISPGKLEVLPQVVYNES